MKCGLFFSVFMEDFDVVSLILSLCLFAGDCEFSREYKNSVWGERYHSCTIGSDRIVRSFDLISGSHIVRRVASEDFDRAIALLNGSVNWVYRSSQVAYDRGSLVWTVRAGEYELRLLERGDYEGARESDQAMELVRMIEEWCRGVETGFPD
jgi:hypothetical protein